MLDVFSSSSGETVVEQCETTCPESSNIEYEHSDYPGSGSQRQLGRLNLRQCGDLLDQSAGGIPAYINEYACR